MSDPAGVITYDGLPGGAHALRAKDPRRAWVAVQAFVDACTRPVTRAELTFRVWADGPADATAALTGFAADLLGGPRTRSTTSTDWNLPVDAVDAALAALADAGSAAVTRHGHPLGSVTWSAAVLLTDPSTAEPYAGVAPDAFGRFPVDGYGRVLGLSGVRATIGTSASSLSLWLNLPDDDRLGAAADRIQEHLPVRLSTKHWRRWRLAKDGVTYRSTKIPSPVGA